jgi:hypothetical protein
MEERQKSITDEIRKSVAKAASQGRKPTMEERQKRIDEELRSWDNAKKDQGAPGQNAKEDASRAPDKSYEPPLREPVAKAAGGTTSEAQSDSESNPKGVMSCIRVAPFGVLGAQMMNSGRVQSRAEMPDDNIAVVDPAGLNHIQPPGRPGGASGAAGAIYKWLRIDRNKQFANDVVASIKDTGDAKYHKYGPRMHVIHAVGPDLRAGKYKQEEAIEKLATCYKNILAEFSECKQQTLRLLPVSSGIFAGDYLEQMPTFTGLALQRGFGQLARSKQSIVLKRKMQLCIFSEGD